MEKIMLNSLKDLDEKGGTRNHPAVGYRLQTAQSRHIKPLIDPKALHSANNKIMVKDNAINVGKVGIRIGGYESS